MAKTAYINARVEPKLKKAAEAVLERVGVNTSDAITMLLRQVVLRNGIPFEVKVPNKETRKAMDELENPKKRAKLKAYTTTDEMFADIFGKKKWELMKKQRGS
jgi:DNA-damage-inducible protein J